MGRPIKRRNQTIRIKKISQGRAILMKLSHEDTNLVITALQDMRANLYINNNMEEMHKVSKVIKGIENEMESMKGIE